MNEHDKALADFAASLADERELFLELCAEGVALIAKDTHDILINSTPVDTGLLKASWVVTLGQRAQAPRRRKRKKGKRGTIVFTSEAAAKESQKSQEVLDGLSDPFTDVYITNPQNYASYVDVGNDQQRGRNTTQRPNSESAGDGGVKAYNLTQLAIAQMQERAYVIGNNDAD